MAVQRTYVVGIAGTGTGALAGLLKAAGHDVTGSDTHVYPPMSDKLAEWGVPVLEGFDAAHLEPAPDLVVVGNVVRRDNPEAVATRERNLPTMSMPQALAHFGIGSRHSVVVAGTHGKTTTTALLAHVLVDAGREPGFLVGGALVGYRESFRLGSGDTFVVEGDEYDTAYFDKGPKFLHYRGKTVLLTSLEFDHADIFADVQAVENAFARLIEQLDTDGHLVVWSGAHRALKLAQNARCQTLTVYGQTNDAIELSRPHVRVVAEDVQLGPRGASFTVHQRDVAPLDYDAKANHAGAAPMHNDAQNAVPTRFEVGLWGSFSVDNALAVVVAARARGLSDAAIAAGLRSFCGVRRRMEVRAEVRGITLVDDFAHHPTAVLATVAAARSRWPGRRLWAIFEPRSATSRRNTFEAEYVQALGSADCAVVAHHARLDEVPVAQRFDPARVANAITSAGGQAWDAPDADAIAARVAQEVRAGDVLMVCSNGSFDDLLNKLEAALQRPPSPGGSPP